MNRLLYPVHFYIFVLLTVSEGCGYFDLDQKPETVTSVPQENNTDDTGASDLDAIRASAEEGDAEAQYRLGWMYDYGESVEEDDAEAMRWYRSAADQGLPEAQNRSVGSLMPNNSLRKITIDNSSLPIRYTDSGLNELYRRSGHYRPSVAYSASGSEPMKTYTPVNEGLAFKRESFYRWFLTV